VQQEGYRIASIMAGDGMSRSREELTKRIQQRDVEALARFASGESGPLLAFIQRQMGARLRRKLEPEDVLQEVTAEAVRLLPETDLTDREPFGWLCQLAQRRIIDAHRRYFEAQKRDAGREVSLGSTAEDSQRGELINMLVATMTTASKAYSRNQRELRLLQALESLPEDRRQVLQLRYVEGLPTKEIAERVGKTDGAVRVLLTRSLARLQEILGPQEETE
jgi:RNA polymerase sigma-70 factor (ECF subfamily)